MCNQNEEEKMTRVRSDDASRGLVSSFFFYCIVLAVIGFGGWYCLGALL